MAILVTPETKVLVQGITGSFGGRHAQLSLEYGSQIVAGVTPGKGGQTLKKKSRFSIRLLKPLLRLEQPLPLFLFLLHSPLMLF